MALAIAILIFKVSSSWFFHGFSRVFATATLFNRCMAQFAIITTHRQLRKHLVARVMDLVVRPMEIQAAFFYYYFLKILKQENLKDQSQTKFEQKRSAYLKKNESHKRQHQTQKHKTIQKNICRCFSVTQTQKEVYP